jgi:hypothetical protein
LADQVDAQGDRSVVVGRDVIKGIINAGDHNQFFIGDYERLRDAYIPPHPVFQRVRLDRFVGRQWLMAEVDTFLRNHDRGYFILEAEAGLGKTTFLAHLMKERGYLHHFVELAPGEGGVVTGLRNLAAQLIRAWQLEDEIGGALPAAASRPDYLQNLLVRAARRRDDTRPREKIILVVDALDEAGALPGQNVLGLPRTLPEDVYLIVSQRPAAVALHTEGPRRVFRLRAESGENQADMHAYLEAAAGWPRVKKALEEGGYRPEQFVETLLEKCRGVWVYLHYLVGEIERGERSPLDLEALPNDLWQYYAQYWERWRGEDDWDTVYLLLLSTLAAAQEGLPLSLLCALANVGARPAWRRLLAERWRPFLAVEGGAEGDRYRLYHASLREFLNGRADLSRLKEAERSLTGDLAEATRAAHSRIADRYLTAWSGLDAGLSGLRETAQVEMDDGYGRRHLAAHLLGAGRLDDAYRLLQIEWVHEEQTAYTRRGLGGLLDRLLGRKQYRFQRRYENAWHAVHERAGDTERFLGDVGRAWEAAVRADEQVARESQETPHLGTEIHCALIQASLNSLAGNIPPALLSALVEQEVWTPTQGLAYARQIPGAEQRVEALAELGSHLPQSLKRQAFAEALAAARALGDERARCEVLSGLVPHLPDPLREEALQEAVAAAWAIEHAADWAKALAGLIPRLPERLQEEVLQETLTAAQAIKGIELQVEALSKLAPCLPQPLRGEVLAETLAAVRTIESGWWAESPAVQEVEGRYQAKALGELAPHLPQPLLAEALAAALAIKDERWRAEALAGLARYLSQPLLAKALAVAQGIGNEYMRGRALAGLAPYLLQPLLAETLIVAWKIGDVYGQAEALTELLPRLAQLGHPEEALAAVREIKVINDRAMALTKMVPYLPESLQGKGVWEAIAAVRKIKDGKWRVVALTGLLPYLPQPLREDEALQEALTATRMIKAKLDKKERAEALADLVPWLSLPMRGKVLAEILATVQTIGDRQERTQALAGLAPHLSEPLLTEALTAARSLPREDEVYYIKQYPYYLQAQALAGVALRLAELGHLKEALATAQEIEKKGCWAIMLPRLASHFQEPPGATERYRVAALAGLAPHLPEQLRDNILQEALAVARVIENKR